MSQPVRADQGAARGGGAGVPAPDAVAPHRVRVDALASTHDITRAARARAAARGPSAAPAARRVPFGLLILGLLGGGLCLLLGLNTVSAAAEVRKQALLQADESIGAQVQTLRQQVAASAAPANLAAAAAALGMVPDGDPAFLTVGPDGRVTVVGTPVPAPAAPAVVVPRPATTTAAAPSGRAVPRAPGARAGSSASTAHPAATTAHPPTARSARPTATPAARPTVTPTPVLSLPGGTR